LPKEQKPATRQELTKWAAACRKRSRLEHVRKEDDPDEALLLSVATPNDINTLLEVRACLFARMSDECLYEVRDLDAVLQRLGRSRYRNIPGICEKVAPAKQSQ